MSPDQEDMESGEAEAASPEKQHESMRPWAPVEFTPAPPPASWYSWREAFRASVKR